VQKSKDILPPVYHPTLSGPLKLGLGDALFENMPQNASILKYDGTGILQAGYVKDELFGGSRPSITGSVFDESEVELIRLDDNQLTLLAEGVDVKLEGKVLKIFNSEGALVLQMTFDPPSGIRFDRLRMRFREIVCEMDRTFGITLPTTRGWTMQCLIGGISAKGAQAAIAYTSDRSRWNGHGPGPRIVGGKGIEVPYSGATLAAGAGSMLLPHLNATYHL
jgi:hypothetical protein